MAARSRVVPLIVVISFVSTLLFSAVAGVEDKGVMLVKRTPRLVNPKHRRHGNSESGEDPFAEDDLDLSAVDQHSAQQDDDVREPESEARMRSFDDDEDFSIKRPLRKKQNKAAAKDRCSDAEESGSPQLVEVFESIESRVKKAQGQAGQQKPVVFEKGKKKAKPRNKGSSRRRTDLNTVANKNPLNKPPVIMNPPPIIPAQPAVILPPIAPIPVPAAPVIPVPAVLPSMPAGVLPFQVAGAKKRSRLMHGQQGPDGLEAWGGDVGHDQQGMIYMVPGALPHGAHLGTPEELDIRMLQDLFAEPTTRIIEIVGDRPGKVLPPQPSPTYQRVMQEAERRKNDPHFPIRNLRNITVNSTESSADTSSPATTQNSTTSTAPTTTQASSSTSKPTTKSIFPQSTTTSSWERRVAELHDRLTGSKNADEVRFKKSLSGPSSGNPKVLQLYHPLAMQFLESPAGQNLFPYMGVINSGMANGQRKRTNHAERGSAIEEFSQNEIMKRHAAERQNKPSVLFAIAPQPAAVAAPVVGGVVVGAHHAIGNAWHMAPVPGNRVLALPPPEADVEAEARMMAKPYEMMHTREKKSVRKRNKRSAEESSTSFSETSSAGPPTPSDRMIDVNLNPPEAKQSNVPPELSTIPLLEYVKKRNLDGQELSKATVATTTASTTQASSTTNPVKETTTACHKEEVSSEKEVRVRWPPSSAESKTGRRSRKLCDVDLERVRAVKRGIDSDEMHHVKSFHSNARSKELLTPKVVDDEAPPLEYTFVLNLKNRAENSGSRVSNCQGAQRFKVNSEATMAKPNRIKVGSLYKLHSNFDHGDNMASGDTQMISVENPQESRTRNRQTNWNLGRLDAAKVSQDKFQPKVGITENNQLFKPIGLVKAELLALDREQQRMNGRPGSASKENYVQKSPGHGALCRKDHAVPELGEYLALLERMPDDQVVQVAETIAKASESGDQDFLESLAEKADVICKLPGKDQTQPAPAGRLVNVKLSQHKAGARKPVVNKPEPKDANEFPLEGFLTSMFRDFLMKKHKEFQQDILQARLAGQVRKDVPGDWPAMAQDVRLESSSLTSSSSEKAIQNIGRSSSETDAISFVRPGGAGMQNHNMGGIKNFKILRTNNEIGYTMSTDKPAMDVFDYAEDSRKSFGVQAKEENNQLIATIANKLTVEEASKNRHNSPPKSNRFVLTSSNVVEGGVQQPMSRTSHSSSQGVESNPQILGPRSDVQFGTHYSGHLTPQAARRFLQAVGETLVASKSKLDNKETNVIVSDVAVPHSLDLRANAGKEVHPALTTHQPVDGWQEDVDGHSSSHRRRMRSSTEELGDGRRNSHRRVTKNDDNSSDKRVDFEITLQLPKELGDPNFLDSLNTEKLAGQKH